MSRHGPNTREWWDRHPEARERARDFGRHGFVKTQATVAARYPWRQILYETVKLANPDPQPCDRCGGEGKMMLHYDDEAKTVELVGWRCYPCRRRDVSV